MKISLEVLGATQAELKALIPQLPKAGKLELRPERDGLFFWKCKGFDVHGAQETLAENASPKSDIWAMKPESKTALAELLTAFVKVCPRRFALYAALSGDLPKRESDIQFSELLELVAGGHLGNRVTYRVKP